MTVDYCRRYIIPAASSLLSPMPSASEILAAIALQESGLTARQQVNGPARGLWQFEVAGVAAVLQHRRTGAVIREALTALCYHDDVAESVHQALEHNDILAACFARCLLWTSDIPLPGPTEPSLAWTLYVDCWRPGTPRRGTWDADYAAASAVMTTI